MNKPTSEYTRDEKSLLLYLESCAVDRSGRLDQQKMNDADRAILKEWTQGGFVESGRICHEDCNERGSTWVRLTDAAMLAASQLRKERAERGWKNRMYKTTEEKRKQEV